ncbi:MAG: hypothetical protein DMG49_00745 [Acidobacteria bacterium]|nr:MAG: hypothetical protein DMG49_00745 [Acidobacteriota bacterium]
MPTNPVSPDLVANFPILHLERIWTTVRRTHGTIARRHRTIGILNPCRRLCGRRAAAFHIHRNRGFRAHTTAETNEFISTEVARLQLISPGKVRPCEALIAGTNAPHPVIILGNVPAWPANKGRMQRFDLLENVGAHAIHGITRQQRNLVEPEAALSAEQDDNLCKRIAL